MNDRLEVRVEGPPNAPTLIYLPGIHGDWYLVTSFRRAVVSQVRFVEFCYPRTTTWSLEEHARAILSALQERGIERGWLLGESFGSQIAWAMLSQIAAGTRFEVSGLILAGGFVRYPWMGGVRLTRALIAGLPDPAVRLLFLGYARYARFRHRQAPETLESMDEFIRRRLAPGDREAVLHRLDLIARSDPRARARSTAIDTWFLSGFWDPVVPWIPVRRWLRRECPGWRSDRVLPRADHTVLATQPRQSAEVILGWMERGASGLQSGDQ